MLGKACGRKEIQTTVESTCATTHVAVNGNNQFLPKEKDENAVGSAPCQRAL